MVVLACKVASELEELRELRMAVPPVAEEVPVEEEQAVVELAPALKKLKKHSLPWHKQA